MSSKNYLFTSESVSEGHPDKVADQISDAILDSIIAEDPKCRVACETLVTTGMAIIAGEISTETYVDMPQIVRETIKGIGYTDAAMGFDWENCAVLTSIDRQSPDIAMGVDTDPGKDKDQGAGDQGMMFGFACDETPDLMPMPIDLANKLTHRLSEARKKGELNWLRPDAKAQVSVEYTPEGKPVRVDTVVIAAQHTPEAMQSMIRDQVIEEVVKKVVPAEMIDSNTNYHINATGRFVMGGPQADCGLTGRKIIVDTYGGMGRHGGGAFSGKDPSKVDRSASYFARYIAKNIVAAKLAKKVEIQLAYSIGVAQPVSINANTFGTGKLEDIVLAKLIGEHFDCRPRAIIEKLDLLKPVYQRTAAYGHFGFNSQGQTWENTDEADALKAKAGV